MAFWIVKACTFRERREILLLKFALRFPWIPTFCKENVNFVYRGNLYYSDMGEGEYDAPFKHYHICLLNKLLLYYYCLNPKYLWIHDYKIF